MRAVASTIFHLMMFPHDEKIMTVDQLTYHNLQGIIAPANVIPTINTINPQGLIAPGNIIPMINTIDRHGLTTPANVIPAINTMVDNIPASPLLNVGPGLFTDTVSFSTFKLALC